MTREEHRQRRPRPAPTPKKFWKHLGVFTVVNAGLITLNLVRSPGKLWFPWVLLGWGTGLLLNGYRVFGCGWMKPGETSPVSENVTKVEKM